MTLSACCRITQIAEGGKLYEHQLRCNYRRVNHIIQIAEGGKLYACMSSQTASLQILGYLITKNPKKS